MRANDAKVDVWWSLMSAHAVLAERVGRDLAAATSLPLGSYNLLRLLHEARDGRVRLSELAKAVHLTRSGVTRSANRLERAGLLRREEHSLDRRGSCAVLTDRGRDQLRRARTVFARAIAEHFGNYLSDGEAETLSAILSRIVKTESGADYQ